MGALNYGLLTATHLKNSMITIFTDPAPYFINTFPHVAFLDSEHTLV
jgi:hypothetical protein